MKPKTRLQVEVMYLTQYLLDIEDKVLSWAQVDCLKHIGYATKNRVICMDCGEKFSTELVSRKRAVCPHCNTKIVIEQSKCRTNKQDIYVAYAQVYGEFQVIRNFEICSYHKVDKPVKYFIMEVLQHWILSDKKREVIAYNHTANWNCDCWNGPMAIRNKSDINKYDIYPNAFHSDSKFKPEYLKIGINKNLKGLTALEAIKYIPTNQKAETLLKAKQYSLLSISGGNDYKIGNYWPSIKICMRNKYIVKDAKIWTDYLDLLSLFKKDLHNSFYVCPKNLSKEHDKLVKKKRAEQNKQDAERKRVKAITDQANFLKLKSKFFGLVFSDSIIEVKVLESVEEYAKEGDIMHHCVFTNSYYGKPQSLVLSARIDNEPVETVEVSLKDFKVIQSRGKLNRDTEYHERIINLVNRNVNKIKKRIKEKQTV